ncbi:MAG: TolC family protein [Burkholderiales bacterium]|nr:TolC family protein [Burkholderiales bacterium]
MSGRRKHVPWVSALATAWLLSLSIPATAGTLLEDLISPSKDPLQTVPDVILTGVTLPGDGVPVPCPAQKNFAMPLNLGEAVDLALCNNAQIRAAWANIKIQAAATGEARAAYWPTLSGTASRINDQTHSGIGSSTINSHTVYGALNWRIFDFGGREANLGAASQALSAALSSHDAVMQKTLSEVIQSYFDAMTTKAAWQAKEQNEAIARSILDTAKRREVKGAGAHSDTLQAITTLARATLDRNRALGAYRKALSVLIYAIGAPSDMQVVLTGRLDEGDGLTIKDLNDWLEAAQKRHPAIVAARAQLEAARYRVASARSDALPTLDFSANYFENGRPGQGLTLARTQERTLGIALTIPIFDGFARTYKIRGAEAQVEQKDAELQDIEHQISMEVVKSHADAVAALQNLQASEVLLTAAQDALDVSKRKYEKGAADILEILSTQTALSDAQQERIRSLADWRSARLRLLANAGLMGRGAANQ